MWSELTWWLCNPKMSPEIEKKSLLVQTCWSGDAEGPSRLVWSIFFLQHRCGVRDGMAASIPVLWISRPFLLLLEDVHFSKICLFLSK